jgi:hypothetical protein
MLAGAKEVDVMTGLGATLYVGFFGLAALWLFVTADRGEGRDAADQAQRPERSNSISATAASVGSKSWYASHSSEK